LSASAVKFSRHPPPQPGRPIQQLGPADSDQKQGRSGARMQHVFDQVEQTVAGPVQVLEDDDARYLLGQRLH
jgi:hypothetical protein